MAFKGTLRHNYAVAVLKAQTHGHHAVAGPGEPTYKDHLFLGKRHKHIALREHARELVHLEQMPLKSRRITGDAYEIAWKQRLLHRHPCTAHLHLGGVLGIKAFLKDRFGYNATYKRRHRLFAAPHDLYDIPHWQHLLLRACSCGTWLTCGNPMASPCRAASGLLAIGHMGSPQVEARTRRYLAERNM